MQTEKQELTQLQRQGVSDTVKGTTPEGTYLEVSYHHGGLYYFCKTSKKDAESCDHRRLKAESIEAAIEETAELLGCVFDPEIEAYCYSNAGTLRAYPRVAKDVYITCATYEPGTDTVRHEPTNVCLIWFDGDDKMHGMHYPDDRANRKYADKIAEALSSYNSNVGAHGKGVERKEWLAWLVGQYICDMEGESPVRVQSLNRKNDPTKLRLVPKEEPPKITIKDYKCKACGHVKSIDTNHYGECYSLGRFNTCPKCPPHAKYPEFGGSTTWECMEQES